MTELGKELNKVDILFVGAGPASLASAIKLKQLLKEKGQEASVVVIEKADKLGQHNLSGAVFEAEVLDELVPGWKESKHGFISTMLANRVEKDEVLYLTSGGYFRLPPSLVPRDLHHVGNYSISVSAMVKWLADIARGLGIEIYTGFAAKELVIEDNIVKGVRLGEKGLDKEEHKMPNYVPGDIIEAKVTILGEGSLGLLAEQLAQKFGLDKGRNHQIHSLGVKEIIKLPEGNKFGSKRVIHTLGFPNKSDVFGGGTLYSMGENMVAVALITALDWKYCDLNPQQELQIFKSHKFVSDLIEGGEVVAYGAKTLPEGGYFSLPKLVANGAMMIGDAAGFTNVKKLKGLHYAIKSGLLAAEAIFDALQKASFSAQDFQKYERLLEASFIIKDLRAARNYRQVFNFPGGIYTGLPLSFIQQLFFKLKTIPDYKGMRRTRLNRTFKGAIDRLTDVSFSGTIHREDEPSHITFVNPDKCEPCEARFGCHPCEYFCPGEVYRFEDHELVLSPSNCLHCQTCRVKCPEQNIKWEVPEGGDGPRYKLM